MANDDNSNVVPFTVRGIAMTRIETEDVSKVSTKDLLDRLEAYGFECEAGPLENCVDWQELKRRLIDPIG